MSDEAISLPCWGLLRPIGLAMTCGYTGFTQIWAA